MRIWLFALFLAFQFSANSQEEFQNCVLRNSDSTISFGLVSRFVRRPTFFTTGSSHLANCRLATYTYELNKKGVTIDSMLLYTAQFDGKGRVLKYFPYRGDDLAYIYTYVETDSGMLITEAHQYRSGPCRYQRFYVNFNEHVVAFEYCSDSTFEEAITSRQTYYYENSNNLSKIKFEDGSNSTAYFYVWKKTSEGIAIYNDADGAIIRKYKINYDSCFIEEKFSDSSDAYTIKYYFDSSGFIYKEVRSYGIKKKDWESTTLYKRNVNGEILEMFISFKDGRSSNIAYTYDQYGTLIKEEYFATRVVIKHLYQL